MPAMGSSGGGEGNGGSSSGSEVQFLYSKLSRVVRGISASQITALESALSLTQGPIIEQQTPAVKQETIDPDADSSEEEDEGLGPSIRNSIAGSTTSLAPNRAVGPAPNVGATKNLGFTAGLGAEDVPPPPPHPTDPEEIRALMRTTMHRCGDCKNRFVEKNLLERHMSARHMASYEKYMEEQRKEMELQRLSELEQVRREEILSGGFIPPADEIDAYISLSRRAPEEEGEGEEPTGPKVTWDSNGRIRLPPRKFPYRKKVSPQCPFCDKRFRNEASLRKHVAKKHPTYIDFVQCNKCYKCLPGAEDLGSGGHDCELGSVCFECRPMRNMCTPERLLSHRAKFHRGPNSGFRCKECGKKCLTPRKLRKHMKMTHVISKPYKCHFCDEFFPTDTQASLHERIHTGKLKYECTFCDYRANRWPKLQRHRREEHGFLCSICQEKFPEYSELKAHTLGAHSGYLSHHSEAIAVHSPRIWILYKGE